MNRMIRVFLFLSLLFPAAVSADGPADNSPDKVKPIPKPGIAVSSQDRQELDRGLKTLDEKIDRLKRGGDRRTTDRLPDVEIFRKAVRDALNYDEFFKPADVAEAKTLLKRAAERAEALVEGECPWDRKTGLVVRGYVSKIDGSTQPYGLVVPESFAPGGGPWRLDVWFHGRDEVLSELKFLADRLRQVGTFAPKDTIVLHPYGRFCNANKFAGEVDLFEAIDDLKKHYRIDDDRVSVRGFSMGGAACWHFAVHYSDLWFAANPGAGFAETPRFLKFFQGETVRPTWYERKLWHLYDCPEVATNLLQCPTVAYSGEIDRQKQAADVMAEALEAEGIELTHVIGPKTAHAYHPQARREVERRMDSLAARGRDRSPRAVSLTTYTLKYNRMNWVTIDALGKHWERAKVVARIEGPSRIAAKTENTTALTLRMDAGLCPFELTRPVVVVLDGRELAASRPTTDRSWTASFHQENGSWALGPRRSTGPVKKHDLQGPIDDAFMNSFLVVSPGGRSSSETVQNWVVTESKRALREWRRQFRGEPRVKRDSDVTDADIAASNLILWGDPESNAVIRKVADRLPIHWKENAVVVGSETFAGDRHVLLMVYPNPLNPERYVVLNSGFTFREYDYLNNARQVPRLPDWAVVDATVPGDSRQPGKIVAANFFGESWELLPKVSR